MIVGCCGGLQHPAMEMHTYMLAHVLRHRCMRAHSALIDFGRILVILNRAAESGSSTHATAQISSSAPIGLCQQALTILTEQAYYYYYIYREKLREKGADPIKQDWG